MQATPRVLAPVLAAALAAPLAAQTVITVPTGQPTIQAGIAAASSGDVVLVLPGTYGEQIDFLGKAITVRSQNGAGATTIDSQGAALWPDHPHGAVVRMISGEGPQSVLEGFTITGGSTPFGETGYGGIYCAGLSPTIRGCVVTGNSGGTGGGVLGNAVLERCIVTGNDSMPYGDGGGVYGAPTIVDSLITGNRSGGLGGGVFATGPCTITRTILDGNVAGNGFDGYSGGGVFGPATLVECEITRNVAHHWFSGGPPDELGTGVDGAVALIACTVADNLVAGDPVPGDPSGGIRDVGTVVDSILWNNEGAQVAVGTVGSVSITYSTVEGGFSGVGNLSLDPLFRDAASGDYGLQPASPAIDAGDPLGPLDPDGTRGDMGARAFHQVAAEALVRNGTGVNPLCFSPATLPSLGTTWTGSVDTTGVGFPVATTVVAVFQGASGPVATAFGELLVDATSPLLLTSVVAPVGGQALHLAPVPADPALGGARVTAQAAVLGTSTSLCNAIDLVLGI